MRTTTSRDNTPIAFEQTGHGPPVVFVMGAFNDRRTGAELARRLAAHFSVYCYDRRGRGDSGDASHYAIEREVDDLDAVLQAAGGSAAVLGFSSGAWLSLTAAAHGSAIAKLALFEPPPLALDAPHAARLARLIAQGRRGDAVEYFQREMVGIPERVIADLRNAPFRPALEAMAHTLVYDATIVTTTQLELSRVHAPVLALAGSGAPPPCGRRPSRSPERCQTHAPRCSAAWDTTSTPACWALFSKRFLTDSGEPSRGVRWVPTRRGSGNSRALERYSNIPFGVVP